MSSFPKYKSKLIVVLPRFPYPLEKGDKLRAYYQLKDLSEHFEIYLFCTSEFEITNESHVQIATFCKEIHVYRLKKGLIFLNLIKALFTKIPFQVAYFSQNWIKRDIEKKIADIDAQHLYCQLVRAAEYVKNIHSIPKTIDLMDALSKGMERRISTINFIYRLVFKEETKRLKHYETKILDYFEHATIISEQDKSFIIHPKNQQIKVIPNGVGAQFFNFDKEVEKEFDLIFTGNMNYAPNVQAALFLAHIFLPLVKKENPRIQIAIVGATPSKAVENCANENMKITGWVDDIRIAYAKSEIFIAPMFSGSGMQNKILEAMAMGIPCITTSLANNAILAEHNEQILLAENEKEMLLAYQKLKNDSDFYNLIAKNAKDFVLKKYNWENSNKQLIHLLEA